MLKFLFFLICYLIYPFAFAATIEIIPKEITQGDPFLLTVSSENEIERCEASFLDQKYPLFKITEKKYGLLSGFDLEDKVGEHKMRVSAEGKNGKIEEQEYTINLKERKSIIKNLTLPDEMAVFSEEEVKLIDAENKRLEELFKNQNSLKYWEGRFINPLSGNNKKNFGTRRLINGEERKRHNGVDISAKCGTPIKAPASGKVILCDNFFLAGKGAVIDHGLGLYSMYFHLNDFGKRCNDSIKRGEIIGYVGKSGRATGCHLHLGFRVRGAKIDPDKLIKLLSAE